MECKTFDPDGVGVDNGTYFGLPFEPATAELVLVSAPWDVTVSYGAGAAYAPDAIIEASTQARFPRSAGSGRMAPGNRHGRRGLLAAGGVAAAADRCGAGDRPPRGEAVRPTTSTSCAKVRRVNEGCAAMNANIESQAARWLDAGRIVGLVGGDHSTPLRTDPGARGAPRRVRHSSYRRPLRPARRLRRVRIFARLDHVQRAARRAAGGADRPGRGARFQRGEAALAASSERIATFDDLSLAAARFRGETWDEQCRRIVGTLPREVYVSFDIDGLTFENCPPHRNARVGRPDLQRGRVAAGRARPFGAPDHRVRRGGGVPRARPADRRHHGRPHPLETLRTDAGVERGKKPGSRCGS